MTVINREPAATPGRAIDSPQLVAVLEQEFADQIHAEPEATGELEQILRHFDAEIQPLFPGSPDELGAPPRVFPAPEGRKCAEAELRSFFLISAPPAALSELPEQVRSTSGVASAYIKPEAVLAAPPPASSTSGTIDQPHLDELGVEDAWRQYGGTGDGVTIFDIEAAWQRGHETLDHRTWEVLGTEHNEANWRNHGTAVLSLLSASGRLSGICPDAEVQLLALEDMDTAHAVYQATNMAEQGDIILIEWQRRGPLAVEGETDAWVPTEWWSDEFIAIRNATQRGIVVIEPAGNGGGHLLHPVYDQAPQGMRRGWSNPFRRGEYDSGAVLVGAGSTGLTGPDCARLPDSNWGAPLDVQAWGEGIVAAGYGDLSRGDDANDERQWYTGRFQGTSAASAIVAGAVACVQGALKGRGLPTLTSLGAREWLRQTGLPQTDAPGRPAVERVGNRVDLRSLLAEMLS